MAFPGRFSGTPFDESRPSGGGSSSGEVESSFVPLNDLERALRDFVGGSGPFEAVLAQLLHSSLYVPVEIESEGDLGAVPLLARAPLILESERGYPGLCAFTSPARAARARRSSPQCGSGMMVGFLDLLGAAPGHLGLLINPGLKVSLEQSPEGFSRLRDDVLGDGVFPTDGEP